MLPLNFALHLLRRGRWREYLRLICAVSGNRRSGGGKSTVESSAVTAENEVQHTV
jgi:hypothetical protein